VDALLVVSEAGARRERFGFDGGADICESVSVEEETKGSLDITASGRGAVTSEMSHRNGLGLGIREKSAARTMAAPTLRA
jgi:hypothetical protein